MLQKALVFLLPMFFISDSKINEGSWITLNSRLQISITICWRANMNHYMLFKNSETVRVKEDDTEVEIISRIFDKVKICRHKVCVIFQSHRLCVYIFSPCFIIHFTETEWSSGVAHCNQRIICRIADCTSSWPKCTVLDSWMFISIKNDMIPLFRLRQSWNLEYHLLSNF